MAVRAGIETERGSRATAAVASAHRAFTVDPANVTAAGRVRRTANGARQTVRWKAACGFSSEMETEN
jgi:hypothetical protein